MIYYYYYVRLYVCVCIFFARLFTGGALPGLPYSTAYKLCALVDIHKTLIVLCCVPYQISRSHAITIVLRLRTKLLKQVK